MNVAVLVCDDFSLCFCFCLYLRLCLNFSRIDVIQTTSSNSPSFVRSMEACSLTHTLTHICLTCISLGRVLNWYFIVELNSLEWSVVYYAVTHTTTKSKTWFQFWSCFCLHFFRSLRFASRAMCVCGALLLSVAWLCFVCYSRRTFVFAFSRWLTSKLNAVVIYIRELLRRISFGLPIFFSRSIYIGVFAFDRSRARSSFLAVCFDKRANRNHQILCMWQPFDTVYISLCFLLST